MTVRLDPRTHLPIIERYVDEAFIDPAQWTRVLDYTAGLIGASASALAVRRSRDTEMLEPVAATWDLQATSQYLEHFGHLDTIPRRMSQTARGVSTVLQELVDIQEFRRSEIYNDWARKHGIAYFAGITFDIDEHSFGVLSFHRSSSSVEFSDEERQLVERVAVPIRYALRHRRLSQELSSERGILARLPMGVIVLDERGGLLYCNPRAEAILAENDGLTVRRNRLYNPEPRICQQLEALIQRVLDGDTGPRGNEMFIPRRQLRLPLHVVAIPLSRRMCESLWQDYVPTALFINDMRPANSLVDLSNMFQRVFGCTRIQAEVACGMVAGRTNKQMVTEGRNAESIKSHVKAVFNKTGVNSRAELRLLADRMLMPLSAR